MALFDNLAFYAPLNSNGNDIVAGVAGTVTGALLTDGKFGKGYSFAGGVTTDNIDYGDTKLGVEYNTGFSINAWIKCGTADRNMQILSKGKDIADFQGWYFYKGTNSTYTHALGVDLISTYGTQVVRVKGSTALNDNVTRMVTMTYDGSGSSGGIKLYVNAVAETVSALGDSNSISSSFQNTRKLMIGNRDTPATNSQAWDGFLDEVRVWNKVLSAAEVSQLYTPGNRLGNLVDNFSTGNGVSVVERAK